MTATGSSALALALSDATSVAYAEVHLASSAPTVQNGLVRKEILRTGHWPVIPTRGGIIKYPLTVIRDGHSDQDKGIIALSELMENFERVGQRVPIPLTDDGDDHANQIRTNTGFVESLEIVDNDDDDARLVAILNFTEPDVREKVLRGTYADVSCGIPWTFTSRGREYGSVLEHVAITNRPFISGLGEFLALSDGDDAVTRDVSHFTVSEPPPTPGVTYATGTTTTNGASPAPPEIKIVDPFGGLTLRQILGSALQAVPEDMRDTFAVIDVQANGVVVQNDESKMALRIPFRVEEGRLVSSSEGWARLKYEGEATPLAEHKPATSSQEQPPPEPPEDSRVREEDPPASPESFADPEDRELEAARQIRQTRMGTRAVAASQSTKKEGHMPLTREELEQLNLSDMAEGQRAAFQKILDENSTLAASNRTSKADERVTELEGIGLKQYPGALKLYRQVMLADDGGPAVVLLSDSGRKQTKTALEILDDFIEAIKGADAKVVLSDQIALVPDDTKPPDTPAGEKKPLPERLADAKAALAGVHGS
jgi:hypothetical protein